MNWDYAELSKQAKLAGGPENYVDQIEKLAWSLGRKEGQKSMIPWLCAAVALVGFVGLWRLIKKLVSYFRKQKAISQEALEQAKAEVVKGIKEYDASHPKEENNGDIHN